MPSNVDFTLDAKTPMGGGYKLVTGWVVCGIATAAYDSSNTIFDLSNTFSSTDYPSVAFIGSTGGYDAQFEGTSASGRLRLRQIDMTNINGIATNSPFVDVTNATNVNLNMRFLAVGKAY